MVEDYDEKDIDEDIESEMEEIEKQEVKAKPKVKPIPNAPVRQPKQAVQEQERYMVKHQPERLMIIDTVKEEIIAEEFKDIGTALAAARMLNNQEKIMTSLGV